MVLNHSKTIKNGFFGGFNTLGMNLGSSDFDFEKLDGGGWQDLHYLLVCHPPPACETCSIVFYHVYLISTLNENDREIVVFILVKLWDVVKKR